MRYLYVFVMIISTIILFYCIVRAYKSEKILARKLGNLLLAAAISMGANIGLILAETESVSNVVYTCFFISFDWLIYNLLAFTLEYTNHTHQNTSIWNTLRVILGIDTASFILHLKLGHAFGINRFEFANGVPYFHVTYRIPYAIHLMISYFLLAIVFVLLVHKAVKSPNIYKKKYYIVLGILMCVMLLNALFVFTKQAYDISMLLFAIGGVLIYYYALTYIPNDLLEDTLSMVVNEMNDAVVLFDVDGSCLYYNHKAESFLKLGSMSETEEKELLRRLTGNQMLSMCEDFWHECTENIAGEPVYLRVFFHRLSDNKNQYLGSYLTIHDRTLDVHNIQREHYRATHDMLTGLYNKEYFMEMVQKCLEEQPNERFLMLCADIKHFKMINNIFGPGRANELLLRIADEMKQNTVPGEVYGRLENDRFAILMKKKDFREHKLIEIPREELQIEKDYSFPVHIQIGVYEITNPNIPISVMCDRALLAIRKIKDDYHKKLAYYDDNLRYHALSEQKLTEDALHAMENGQIQIYLQPQVTADGVVKGAESLVRWIHPERGLILPKEFIPIFEKNSLIVSLDQYIWKMACRQLQSWKKAGREDLYISINISPKDFFYMDVTKILCNLVKEYDISTSNLKIEITETAIMADLSRQMQLIKNLREAGFTIEMDNFGRGYSSFNMLKNIAVDDLKIDVAFLKEADSQERAQKILKMIVELAKELNLMVITEGVETEEQFQYLKEIGCDLFQGYYFDKPMNVKKFEEKYL